MRFKVNLLAACTAVILVSTPTITLAQGTTPPALHAKRLKAGQASIKSHPNYGKPHKTYHALKYHPT
jgi:hypothetical protein